MHRRQLQRCCAATGGHGPMASGVTSKKVLEREPRQLDLEGPHGGASGPAAHLLPLTCWARVHHTRGHGDRRRAQQLCCLRHGSWMLSSPSSSRHARHRRCATLPSHHPAGPRPRGRRHARACCRRCRRPAPSSTGPWSGWRVVPDQSQQSWLRATIQEPSGTSRDVAQ